MNIRFSTKIIDSMRHQLLVGLLTGLGICSMMTAVHAAQAIAGTASLSGSVTAATPFTAAQVYARNIDKNMLYMVFTNRGQYSAINLLPGAYEVWAEKGGLKSEHQLLRIQPGEKVIVDHSLQHGPDFPLTSKDRAMGGAQFGQGSRDGVELLPYDELYASGPGHDIAVVTCISCHGQSFLPGQHRSKGEWFAIIDVMLNPVGAFAQGSTITVTPEQRETLADYLTSNFGPDSAARGLKIDVEYPLDEEMLSKAMFIEYLMPLGPDADIYRRSKARPGRHRALEPKLDNFGNIWATNGIIGITKLDPRTAQFSHFPFGTDTRNPEVDMYGKPKSDPASVWSNIYAHGLTIDSENQVFWLEFQGQHAGRLDPETGKMDRFPLDPEGVVVDERGVAGNIRGHTPHLDSQENVWFTVIRGNKIGVWKRSTEKITLWEIPTAHSFPYGIDMDENDEVWFAELFGCKVGRFDPRTERFTEYPSLSTPCALNRLTADSKGIIWYSVFNKGILGRLDPKTGEQVEYDILPFTEVNTSQPYGIIADLNDHIWFGDGGLGGALTRFDPEKKKFDYFPEPRQADNPNIDVTREGAIIYTSRSSEQAAIGIFYPDVSKMTGYGAYR
jgi:streptogramin lyase